MSNHQSHDGTSESNRVVALGDGISHKMVDGIQRLMLQYQATSNEPINLLINSGGGITDASLRLCDLIEHVLIAPVHGWVIGQCYSSATYPLLYCKKRVCTPFSTFAVHSIRVSVKRCHLHELRQLVADTEKAQAQLIQFYVSRLRRSQETVEELLARGDRAFDDILSAQEAIDFGLVEEIISGKIPLFNT